MEIPQIPTDNLYKFLALFGIVIMAAYLIVPMYFDQQFQVRAIQAQAEADAVQAKIDGVSDRERAQAVEMTYQEKTRQLAELRVEQARAEGKKKEAEFLVKQSQRMLRWTKRGTVSGALVSMMGFLLWYLNLQRWQDLAQKKKAASQPAH